MKVLKAMAVVGALVASSALAHESGGRATGTIEGVTADRIVVRTSDGHEVAYAVTPATRFLKGDKQVRLEDVRVGQRAVVHGKRAGDAMQAVQVKIGAEAAPK